MADTSNAQIGSKSRLAWGSGSPPSYTYYANVRSIGPIGADSPEVDSTDLDSLAVERIPGLPDGIELEIRSVMNSSTVPIFESQYYAATLLHLRISRPAPFNDSRYFGFVPLGFRTLETTPQGLTECSMRGRISGQITSASPPDIIP